MVLNGRPHVTFLKFRTRRGGSWSRTAVSPSKSPEYELQTPAFQRPLHLYASKSPREGHRFSALSFSTCLKENRQTPCILDINKSSFSKRTKPASLFSGPQEQPCLCACLPFTKNLSQSRLRGYGLIEATSWPRHLLRGNCG